MASNTWCTASPKNGTRLALDTVYQDVLRTRILERLSRDAQDPSAVIEIKLSGVYFLFHLGGLVYVGQSTHVPTRIAQHKRSGFVSFDSVAWIPCARSELLDLEVFFIGLLNPRDNKTGPGAKNRREYEAAILNEDLLGYEPEEEPPIDTRALSEYNT